MDFGSLTQVSRLNEQIYIYLPVQRSARRSSDIYKCCWLNCEFCLSFWYLFSEQSSLNRISPFVGMQPLDTSFELQVKHKGKIGALLNLATWNCMKQQNTVSNYYTFWRESCNPHLQWNNFCSRKALWKQKKNNSNTPGKCKNVNWLVVEPTHLKKYESKWESFPQGSGLEIKNIWVATTQNRCYNPSYPFGYGHI